MEKKEDLEIALIRYNKKTWCKSALLGFFVGLAVIVPGISGSTVAIIFRLYDQFLYALGNLFRQFKKCFFFLLPIGIGIGIGVLFAGLMCGSFPAVKDELKGAKMTGKRIALLVVGALIPIAIGVLSVALNASAGETGNVFADVRVWQIIVCIPVGYVVGLTQIVPGLSASAILLALGWFRSLVDSVSLTFWKSEPMIFLVYAALAVGFLLGIFTFSRFLTWIFGKARHTAYSMIVGLSLGSIVAMFYNPDVFSVYVSWTENGVNAADLVLGIVLFAVGVVGAYLLVRYQRKKDAEALASPQRQEPSEPSDSSGQTQEGSKN